MERARPKFPERAQRAEGLYVILDYVKATGAARAKARAAQ